MKRYIQSSVILLAAIALAGCAKTEEFQCNPDSALQIESVSGISPFSLMQAPASKAVITGESLPADEATKGIGLFVTAADGSAYDGKTEGYSNVKFTYSSEKWSAASPVYLSNTTGKLYGYFPYSADATDLSAVPVQSSLNGTDYLYATPQEVSFSNKSVNLQMNHALARLHLTVKKGANYKATGVISGITLESTAIDATGTMDITTGEISTTKEADIKGTVALTAGGSLSNGEQIYDILLVPADNADGKKPLVILISIDGKSAGVSLSGENGLFIQSGKQDNLTLTIEDTGIKVSGVGVGTWGDGGSQTVEVSGHTVTVKLDEEVEDIEKDVWVMAYAQDGNSVIKSFSSSGKTITCQLDDDTMVNPVSDENVSVFKLSDVSEDIIATIGVFGEGGRKEVTVNGHKVKVVYDEVEDIVKDVWATTYVDGNNVIIRASSYQSKRLICNVGDNAQCERTITNDKFTFTISEIHSDIEAVLGYAPLVTLAVTSDSNGKVWIGDDKSKTSGQFESGQQVVIHADPNDKFRLFRWNDNNRETSRTITVGDTDTEYSASFISSDLIPGLFTVSSGKQVFFSKGNLWCDGTGTNYSSASPKIKSWGFESNQYDTPSISIYRSISHISHFLWCADESNAVCEKYNDAWNVNDVFLFTNADATTPNPNFAVNGKQGYWRVLSGGTGGEWKYLLETRTMKYSKPRYTKVFGVSIGGVTCEGLFIYPDDYSGNEVGASGGPGTWADINAAGIVFLPAAGYRDGSNGDASVLNVGSHGYYWSASPRGNDYAYLLYFDDGIVMPSVNTSRDHAYSVRLVTECQ